MYFAYANQTSASYLKEKPISYNPLVLNGNNSYRIIKIFFLNKKSVIKKKIPMSTASMSR